MHLQYRPRRNRSTSWIRDLVQENNVTPRDLILPVFVHDAPEIEPIASMPGVERHSMKSLVEIAKKAHDLGIPALAIFPATPPNLKDEKGSEALNPENLVCRALGELKAKVPDMGLITDVALDPYTSHGHDGLLENGQILNDESVEILCAQALNQAKAGCDIIAPSDMMDGRVGAIRNVLDGDGFSNVLIMSYAAKYASKFYGPFRDAVGSGGALKGDKKTYQMNPANSAEALREVDLDIQEGADIIMIKPGMPYLDIIHAVKREFQVPVSAYHVSGEYAMLRAAAEKGWLDYDGCIMEVMMAFKRAGCDMVLTYAAMDVANMLK